jgi:DNA replication protein DnaC
VGGPLQAPGHGAPRLPPVSGQDQGQGGTREPLAIALGIAATEAGYLTYFTSAADLVANLESAHLEGTASYKMRTYTGPSVLVVDELGYLPLDQASANWIFQMVSRRYE